MSGEQFSILAVCVGNVCRSPLMERLLTRRLAGSTRFVVSSAGVQAAEGRPIDEKAAAELVRLGGSFEDFASRRLTEAAVSGADLVLTASRPVRSQVLAACPSALHRTFTLLELCDLLAHVRDDLAPGARPRTLAQLVAWVAEHRSRADPPTMDVTDPIGRSAETHRGVAEVIDDATRRIADALLEAQCSPSKSP